MDDDKVTTGGAPAKGSTKVAAIGDNNVSPTFRESEDTPSTLLNAQQNCLTHAVDVSYLVVVVVVVVYKTAKLLTDFISVSSFFLFPHFFFFFLRIVSLFIRFFVNNKQTPDATQRPRLSYTLPLPFFLFVGISLPSLFC